MGRKASGQESRFECFKELVSGPGTGYPGCPTLFNEILRTQPHGPLEHPTETAVRCRQDEQRWVHGGWVPGGSGVGSVMGM